MDLEVWGGCSGLRRKCNAAEFSKLLGICNLIEIRRSEIQINLKSFSTLCV